MSLWWFQKWTHRWLTWFLIMIKNFPCSTGFVLLIPPSSKQTSVWPRRVEVFLKTSDTLSFTLMFQRWILETPVGALCDSRMSTATSLLHWLGLSLVFGGQTVKLYTSSRAMLDRLFPLCLATCESWFSCRRTKVWVLRLGLSPFDLTMRDDWANVRDVSCTAT